MKLKKLSLILTLIAVIGTFSAIVPQSTFADNPADPIPIECLQGVPGNFVSITADSRALHGPDHFVNVLQAPAGMGTGADMTYIESLNPISVTGYIILDSGTPGAQLLVVQAPMTPG